MNVTVRRVTRLDIELGPGDKRYYVTNQFNPAFHMYPDQVLAELDADNPDPDPRKAVLRAEVTGQRLRLMASGEVKMIPPQRGMRADRPTTWEFRYPHHMPRELLDLIYDAWRLR